MKLNQITKEFIEEILKDYALIEGDELNQKLLKLFHEFSDDTNKFEVMIKVAALNKIYSTAITNINPVVEKINETSKNYKFENLLDYVRFVDKIACVKWKNEKGEEFERTNLSFASKYTHFISNFDVPIYDSYIWIVIKGYLGQSSPEKLSFRAPKNYEEFYSTFTEFKIAFNLENYDNYKIDKFLWTYGRNMIFDIVREKEINLEAAKSELKKRLKSIT